MALETRAKISAKLRGRRLSSEHRRNIAASKLGVPLSDEHRANVIAGQLRTGPAAMQRQAEVYRGRLTKGEAKMAEILEGAGVRFQAQVAIWMYIADFLVWPNIVLEVDGPSQTGTANAVRRHIRDTLLTALGFVVVRVRETHLGDRTNG